MEVIRCIAYLTMDCSYNKYEWKQNHGKIYNFVSIYNSEHELMNIHFTQKKKKKKSSSFAPPAQNGTQATKQITDHILPQSLDKL
jgi:hypothetical protein